MNGECFQNIVNFENNQTMELTHSLFSSKMSLHIYYLHTIVHVNADYVHIKIFKAKNKMTNYSNINNVIMFWLPFFI